MNCFEQDLSALGNCDVGSHILGWHMLLMLHVSFSAIACERTFIIGDRIHRVIQKVEIQSLYIFINISALATRHAEPALQHYLHASKMLLLCPIFYDSAAGNLILGNS